MIGAQSGETQSITPFVVPQHLLPVEEAGLGTDAGMADKLYGGCDPATAADIYRTSGAIVSSVGGCGPL